MTVQGHQSAVCQFIAEIVRRLEIPAGMVMMALAAAMVEDIETKPDDLDATIVVEGEQ